MPQPPQLFESVAKLTQVFPQALKPFAQHKPWSQYFPAPQAFPHAPQLLLSVCLLTQVGNPFTVQTSGEDAGQLQLWEHSLPAWSVLIWQEVAPTGQHILCVPAEGVQPKPQVNSAQKSQVSVLPQTQAPFWQTSYWAQACPQLPQLS
jgi:hypothetical protein